MDTYANMQSVGIEPPRMRGLDTDPAAAAAGPPLSSRGAPLSSRGAAAGGGAGGAALRSSSSGAPLASAGSELGEGPSSAAVFDPFGMGSASGSPAGGPDGAGRPAGGSAWASPTDYSRPAAEEDGAGDWRGDVRRSAAEGAALLGGAGAAGAPPRSDVRQSAEAYSPAQQQASPGQGGGVSLVWGLGPGARCCSGSWACRWRCRVVSFPPLPC